MLVLVLCSCFVAVSALGLLALAPGGLIDFSLRVSPFSDGSPPLERNLGSHGTDTGRSGLHMARERGLA